MFEEDLKKLDEMVRIIRSEETTLDDALKAYNEGMKAYESCRKVLEETKGKIEVANGKDI
ncbi:MAG: exodeoxyribonuclease VII small subunit [Firmicutes bacterium]|jgi:exodeoxyribonuclease VII small subunit|nr:exodeoxyribonuclease VII small subunit [Bacillota bacterium]MBQ1431395.1 exodeoxyribonuclease VII small subunit [Bacillota bacterium]MBQ1630949.1 exodeoxyribonuclease VII small subunit [Bacillota bacterium]MBQ1691099.1 exodeoxyribonuclease VII small subunit [Bacillota bacterium]MBQ1716173.1 exodeoxyribonuclease VII small subunit [Bacillota bacterium]